MGCRAMWGHVPVMSGYPAQGYDPGTYENCQLAAQRGMQIRKGPGLQIFKATHYNDKVLGGRARRMLVKPLMDPHHSC